MATPVYESYLPFATPPMEDGFNMDFDWPSLDFDGSLTTSTEPPLSVAPPTAVKEPDCSPADPASICARQLSDLSVALDGVHSKILSYGSMHVSKDDPISDLTRSWAEKYSKGQCLEQLFTLAQQLLDVYPRAMALIFKSDKDHGEECHDENCIHRQDIPSELKDSFPAEDEKNAPIDLFLLNLLILCHMRVSDIFELMILHASTCAKATLARPDLREPELHIPELRVGSFVASAEAASTMQIVLLIHITSVLAERAKQLDERVNNVAKEESSTKQARLVKLQCEVLVEGAESKVLALQKVRDLLSKMGFMKGLQPV